MGTSTSPRTSRSGWRSPLTLAVGGMLAALIFVATSLLTFPIPMTSGYVHLGDAIILLGAGLLGWLAIPAAALGSMLADLLLGYVTYALPTFLIKGAVAAIAALGAKRKPLALKALFFLLAEVVMVLSYFLVEWLLMGYGAAGAWANVPGNAIQGASGIILAMVFLPLLGRVKLPGAR